MDERDIAYLRDRLRDYYGTAMTSGFPMAVMELSEVDSMSDDKSIVEAERLGII